MEFSAGYEICDNRDSFRRRTVGTDRTVMAEDSRDTVLQLLTAVLASGHSPALDDHNYCPEPIEAWNYLSPGVITGHQSDVLNDSVTGLAANSSSCSLTVPMDCDENVDYQEAPSGPEMLKIRTPTGAKSNDRYPEVDEDELFIQAVCQQNPSLSREQLMNFVNDPALIKETEAHAVRFFRVLDGHCPVVESPSRHMVLEIVPEIGDDEDSSCHLSMSQEMLAAYFTPHPGNKFRCCICGEIAASEEAMQRHVGRELLQSFRDSAGPTEVPSPVYSRLDMELSESEQAGMVGMEMDQSHCVPQRKSRSKREKVKHVLSRRCKEKKLKESPVPVITLPQESRGSRKTARRKVKKVEESPAPAITLPPKSPRSREKTKMVFSLLRAQAVFVEETLRRNGVSLRDHRAKADARWKWTQMTVQKQVKWASEFQKSLGEIGGNM